MSLYNDLFPNTYKLMEDILDETTEAAKSIKRLLAEGADLGRCMRHDKATYDRLRYRLGTVWASNIHMDFNDKEDDNAVSL